MTRQAILILATLLPAGILAVGCANESPRVGESTFAGTEDIVLADVLAATDADGDPLTYSVLEEPIHGTLDLDPQSGRFTYSPAPNWNGTDGFVFSVTDGEGSVLSDATLTIAAVNDTPEALAGTLELQEDTPITGLLGARDIDEDTLTWELVLPPSNGTLDLNPNDGSFTFTPDANFHGQGSFSFQVTDGELVSSEAAIAVSVASINDRPDSTPGMFALDEDTTLTSQLVAVDVDGDALTYEIVTSALLGAVTLDESTGAFTYVPDANENGTDSFRFRATDGASPSDSVLVTLTIAPINDAPVASSQSVTMDSHHVLSGTLVASDVDDANLTYEIVSQSASVSISLNAATGNFTYTNDTSSFFGTRTFQFRASDGDVFSASRTVTVTTRPINWGTSNWRLTNLTINGRSCNDSSLTLNHDSAFVMNGFTASCSGVQEPYPFFALGRTTNRVNGSYRLVNTDGQIVGSIDPDGISGNGVDDAVGVFFLRIEPTATPGVWSIDDERAGWDLSATLTRI